MTTLLIAAARFSSRDSPEWSVFGVLAVLAGLYCGFELYRVNRRLFTYRVSEYLVLVGLLVAIGLGGLLLIGLLVQVTTDGGQSLLDAHPAVGIGVFLVMLLLASVVPPIVAVRLRRKHNVKLLEESSEWAAAVGPMSAQSVHTLVITMVVTGVIIVAGIGALAISGTHNR